MSNVPENNLDLESLFLPAWAQQSASVNQYADFEGESAGGGDRRRPRGRESRPGGFRDRGPRPGGPGGPGGAPRGGQGQERRGDFRGQRPFRGGGGGPRRFGGPERREAPPVQLPHLDASILPEEKGVESLARQIRLHGRAYPLFDIGYLILKKPERFNVQFNVIKQPDGKVAQPLFLCSLDDTLWLSEDDAVRHILDRHFATFYQSEKIPADPPKGVFTFVAQCGMTGTILGPPNLHDYQTKLHRLHSERFANMPFEVFKSRIKIVRDEAVVKQWIEEQSFKTEYICLNVPETLRLGSREEVEKHFRATHLPNVVQSIETYTLAGNNVRSLQNPGLFALYRKVFEEQKRFPIKVVTALSQAFAGQGLQFFKVKKSITHVGVSRPHFLDVNVTPVSDGVKKIIGFINATPGCTRKQLLEALAPGAVVETTPAPAVEAPAPTAAAPAVTPEGAAPAAPVAEAAAVPAAPAPAPAPEPSPEVKAVVADLHWLIHQGHVIEFANGVMETAKPAPPKPPKPAPKPKVEAAPAVPAAIAEPAAASTTEGATQPAPAATELPAASETPAAPAAPEAPANPAQ